MAASLDHTAPTLCGNCNVLTLLQEYASRIEELEKTVAEQAEITDAQAREIADLKKELAKYDNPHTPSSAKSFKEKPKRKDGQKKCGAPKGHRGATRPTPEPEEYVPVTANSCERCGSTNIEEVGIDPAVRENLIRQLQQIKVTQYDRGMYKCHDCGHEFTAKHEDCPQKGRFGINLLVYITMLKFSLRGVLRKIEEFTAHTNSFDISPTGIHDVLLRVGEACKKEYFRTLERVRNAEWRYMDETGMRVKGKNWWLWIFRTTTDVLVVIRPSRGRKVLEEILGIEINGAGISDGWRAYSAFDVLQRCWAHLLREVDAFTDKSGGRELSEIIHRMFKELKEFLGKDPPMEERIRQKKIWDKEMEDLVELFSGFKELEKPLTYIRNGLGSWYTCLLYPGMEPTNNLGEQVMREHVLMRKIIGTFRSEKGAENYQYIASMFATWRLQGKDIYKELEELLRQELCLR
jgi:transposase/uncharacterized coiled-coil protein SlyX